MPCAKSASMAKFFVEISVIAAMFDEIFSSSTVAKLREMEQNQTAAGVGSPISLLLSCTRDHIKAQLVCLKEQKDSKARRNFVRMKPAPEFKRTAASLCAQIQATATKYNSSLPAESFDAGCTEWVPLVWNTFVLSNFIELYFFEKIGEDGTDIEDYIHATLRSIAHDLTPAVKRTVSPAGPMAEAWQRWVDGAQARFVPYPLTQRLWNKVAAGERPAVTLADAHAEASMASAQS